MLKYCGVRNAVAARSIPHYADFDPDAPEFSLLWADGRHDSTGSSNNLIGANGAGKTAVLEALGRLFGITSADRQITRTGFYLPPDMPADEVQETCFFIEARIDFPELADSANSGAIPECFNQMVVASQGASPYRRIRLEATWRRTSTPDGEIEEAISWVTTDAVDPPPEAKRPMRSFDRTQIQVVYVPATRDPFRQMRRVAGSLLYRLLRPVNWSDAVREAVIAASEQLHTAFRGEAGVSQIESALGQAWRRLHDFSALGAVELQPVSHRSRTRAFRWNRSHRPIGLEKSR